MKQTNLNEYFSGAKLYGDDFTPEQITKWYEEEAEGYANLGNSDVSKYNYGYHEMNIVHGFSKIEKRKFKNVLGLGSAWGHEFQPIIGSIENLTLLEPSEQMKSAKIGEITPKYVKPRIDGKIDFDNNSFDLITSFGVLHHIPNVSFVLSELIRILSPNGYLLIKEPVVSMGDWRFPRAGLTKNERGIPLKCFESIFEKSNVHIYSKSFCFTNSFTMHKLIGKYFEKPLYSYRTYVAIDKVVSKLLAKNIRYHPQSSLNKIGPSNVFFVLKKD
jgi:SAM-dependent methyltransferase